MLKKICAILFLLSSAIYASKNIQQDYLAKAESHLKDLAKHPVYTENYKVQDLLFSLTRFFQDETKHRELEIIKLPMVGVLLFQNKTDDTYSKTSWSALNPASAGETVYPDVVAAMVSQVIAEEVMTPSLMTTYSAVIHGQDVNNKLVNRYGEMSLEPKVNLLPIAQISTDIDAQTDVAKSPRKKRNRI